MLLRGAGLFGGTFNPIHTGHLRIAEEVREAFDLSRIYFIPSAVPPHKTSLELADAADRFEMIQRAIAAHPDFVISDAEIKRQGRSYTIDTVRYFKTVLPENTPCYLLMGADAFFEIDTWKAFDALFDQIPVIVMRRPGPDASSDAQFFENAARILTANISKNYRFSADRSVFEDPRKQPVFLFNVTSLDISSTRIRDMVRQRRSIRFLVPDVVEKYIQSKGLYHDPS
jgi:nicotinate-nucleotide adenylyltransferase